MDKAASPKLANLVTIRPNNVVIVRSQAGWRKALRAFWGGEHPNEAEQPVNYPKVYPALVVFNNGYNGSDFIRADIFPLSELKKIVDNNV